MACFTINYRHTGRNQSKFYRIDTSDILMAKDVDLIDAALWAIMLEDMIGRRPNDISSDGYNLVRSPYVAYKRPAFKEVAPCQADASLIIESKNTTDARLDIFIEHDDVKVRVNDLYACTPYAVVSDTKRVELMHKSNAVESCILNYRPTKSDKSIHIDALMTCIGAGIAQERMKHHAHFQMPSYDFVRLCTFFMARALHDEGRVHDSGNLKIKKPTDINPSPVHVSFGEAGFIRSISPRTPHLYKICPTWETLVSPMPDFLMRYAMMADAFYPLASKEVMKICLSFYSKKDAPQTSSHDVMSAHRLAASLEALSKACLTT